jgi:hypothetical protein
VTKIKALSDPSVLTVKHGRTRQLSPETIKRREEVEKLRGVVAQLTDVDQVFQIDLEPGEKPLTVRNRLQRVAREQGKEIAVRKHGDGFAIGLMTEERRERRGRPKRTA